VTVAETWVVRVGETPLAVTYAVGSVQWTGLIVAQASVEKTNFSIQQRSKRYDR